MTSSRALVRALNHVFEAWDDDLARLAVYQSIEEFHLRHNTSSTVRSTMNICDEMFNIYHRFISSDENIDKELLFLDLLRNVAPVMTESEILLWLHTYLKPAVDSAGYDLAFVAKLRAFVSDLTVNPKASDDPALLKQRQRIGEVVVDHLIKIYLGNHDVISLDSANGDSEMHERVRFIERNCADLIKEYGLQCTRLFFSLANHYFKVGSKRLKVLVLISQMVACQTSQVNEIIETSLFGSLLRAVAYDLSSQVVTASLSVLVMMIPQVCQTLRKYVPDLFLLHVRLVCWNILETDDRVQRMNQFFKDKMIEWDLAGPDPEPRDIDGLFYHLLLYGLFPINFSQFSKHPFAYFHKNPPTLVDLDFLESLDLKLEQHVVTKSRTLLRHYVLHPNFVNGVDAEAELANPLAWLLADADGDLVCEDIALACFNFIPDVFTELERRSLPRKVSIVPTNLVIDGPIAFKEVDYNSTRSSVSEDGGPADLFYTHEKLYSLTDEKRRLSLSAPQSASSFLNDKLRNTSSPTTSVETLTVLSNGLSSALDFYQRELLILKNELEFSSYMKHLIRHNYVRTRIRLNKVLKEHATNNDPQHETFAVTQSALEEAVRQLQSEKDQLNIKHRQEKVEIVNELLRLRDENDSLKQNLGILTDEQSTSQDAVKSLKHQLSEVQSQLEHLQVGQTQVREDLPPTPPPPPAPPVEQKPDPTIPLRGEILVLEHQNKQLSKQVDALTQQLESTVTKYEAQLSASKHAIDDEVRKYIVHYERRAQEYSNALLKFESLIEDKDARIMQLQTSKPISIPTQAARVSQPDIFSPKGYKFTRHPSDMGDLESKDRSNSSVDSEAPAKNAPPPIVRGRGGYQKRSKRIM